MEDYIIRPMEIDDIKQVHDIDVLSFSQPWPEHSYRFEIKENQVSRQWVVEVTDTDGNHRVVAMVVLWLIQDEGHIATFAVHPDYRRQGIGRRLFTYTLAEALKEGIGKTLLEVRRGNIIAQRMYKQYGFKVTAVRHHYYRDNSEDALLMSLDPLTIDVLQGCSTRLDKIDRTGNYI